MRKLFLTLITLLSLTILWINLQLYSTAKSRQGKTDAIVLQLNFLESELKNNQLGEDMQKLFPEGFVFAYATYGLAWCELALADSGQHPDLQKRAIEEAIYAFDAIDSKTGREPFFEYMEPTYGIFYWGWRNYLLAKLLKVESLYGGEEIYKAYFMANCDFIANYADTAQNPYLPSYPEQSWPCDMFVAMASLKLHDEIYPPKYEALMEKWLQKVKANLDPETGFPAHKVDVNTAATIQGPRGSSATLMLRLFAEIDHDFAKEQFVLF